MLIIWFCLNNQIVNAMKNKYLILISTILLLNNAVLFSQNASEHIDKANKAINSGDYYTAISEFSSAIKLLPEEPKLWYNRANIKLKTEDYKGAIEDYSKAIELDTAFADAYYNRGIAKDKTNNFEGAIRDNALAIKYKPSYSDAYFNSAVEEGKISSYMEAIDKYTKVLEFEPESRDAYFYRGVLKGMIGENRAAELDLSIAIDMEDTPEAFFQRGIVRYNMSKFDEAIDDFNYSINMAPDNDLAFNSIGLIYAVQEKYEKSIEFFNKAIEINPENAEAYYNRGASRLALDPSSAEGCSDLKKASELGHPEAAGQYDFQCK